MNPRTSIPALLTLLLLAPPIGAQDSAIEQGAALYDKECSVCHGSAARKATGYAPDYVSPRPVFVAALGPAHLDTAGAIHVDAPDAARHVPVNGAGTLIAVVPPYGPPLQGVYGRTAGSMEGFIYSKTFMEILKGIEWNEDTLDVFITNTQARAPGIYMFYKQKNPEIRRKIIEYLKANR